MKILDIINENYIRHGHNVAHFDPSDLSFTAQQRDEDHVNYTVLASDGKRIGVFTLWNCADTVFIWSELKAPDKAHIFKLMGVIPKIVLDYMDNSYYPEGSFPDDFKIDLESAITKKRFTDWDYYYYCVNVLGGNYRITRNSDTFRIMPLKVAVPSNQFKSEP